MVLVPPADAERVRRRAELRRRLAFALEPVSDHTTRLVMLSLTAKRRLADRIFWEPAHFVMERKMMLTIKQLAEASAN